MNAEGRIQTNEGGVTPPGQDASGLRAGFAGSNLQTVADQGLVRSVKVNQSKNSWCVESLIVTGRAGRAATSQSSQREDYYL